jgi:D-3-phosphoglycerate dehydrogenase
MSELFAEADFVTLHVPETPQTKNLIGREELSRMRPGSYLLNASRGTVVVIDALAEALKSKHLAGCAIDVYPEEPEANGDDFATPLRNLPNVILTPHVGGSTVEAQESIGREVATSFVKFLTAGTTTGAVNFPQIELPRAEGSRRILNVHRNVPGVLRDINKIVSDRDANISAQMLSTDADIGYMVMDVETAGAEEVADAIGALTTSLRTRTIG